MSKLEVDTIAPQSGTTVTVGESGDTVTIPTGVTLDASNATTTLPSNIVTTDGSQTLTNKSIDASQLTGTITPSDNTVSLAKLTATGTKDATTFLRGDNTFAVAGGTNTPMVYAYMNASQTPSNNTHTKIQYNTEVFDTDSAYDSSTNYRFTVPSGKDGKYLINASCYMFGNNNDEVMLEVSIYKNGTQVERAERYGNYSTGQNSGGVQSITRIIDLSASDYIEIYGRLNVNSGTPSFYGASATDQRYSVLNIAKMIE